jgi:uncharacterized protein (DUF983 family)
VRGQLLAPPQAAAGDIGRKGLDDSPINGAITVDERRHPIHKLFLPVDSLYGALKLFKPLTQCKIVEKLPMLKLLSSPEMAVFVRGLCGRCPRCSEGRMFRKFLKVIDRCEACGEELHHHRADDFPAHIVISIVGHIIVSAVLYAETHFAPSSWTHLALWLPTTLILTLGLLQPTKGPSL